MDGDESSQNVHINLSRPCPMCGNAIGYLVAKSGQLTTWCNGCGIYQYNTPHAEIKHNIDEAQRRRRTIKPAKRTRVLKRWQHRCASCGAGAHDVELHIGHLVPLAEKQYMPANKVELLDHEFNLVPMCADCNLGYSAHAVALALMVQVLEKYVREAPK